MGNPLVDVQRFGQSIWYDNIHRSFIESGELSRLIERDGLLVSVGGLGLLVRPDMAIFMASSDVFRAFEKPHGGRKIRSDYDAGIRTLAGFSWIYFGYSVP